MSTKTRRPAMSDMEAITLDVVRQDCERAGFSLRCTHVQERIDSLVHKGHARLSGHYGDLVVAL